MGRLHCLTIIGQIEGHIELSGQTKTTKYEHILPLLAGIEESDDIDGLLLLLNTVGGDIEAGLAIAEMIFERHEIISEFLMKLGVSSAVASEDACRIEHVISSESFAALKDYTKNNM